MQKKKNINKKSKYYRQKQVRMQKICIIGLVLLLAVLILSLIHIWFGTAANGLPGFCNNSFYCLERVKKSFPLSSDITYKNSIFARDLPLAKMLFSSKCQPTN